MLGAPQSQPLHTHTHYIHTYTQTVSNDQDHSNEVVMLSGLVHPEVSIDGQTERPELKFTSFTGVRKLDGAVWPLDIQQKVCACMYGHIACVCVYIDGAVWPLGIQQKVLHVCIVVYAHYIYTYIHYILFTHSHTHTHISSTKPTSSAKESQPRHCTATRGHSSAGSSPSFTRLTWM